MYNEYPERIYIDRGIDAGTAALLKDNSANEMLPWMTMMNNGGMGFGNGGWWFWILFLLWGRNGWAASVVMVTIWSEQVFKIDCQQFKKQSKTIITLIC